MSANTPRQEFYEIDCLRGVAIAIVFSIHAEGIVNWMYRVPPEIPLWRAFVYGGHTAPTLFFVLSAFLLSRPFLAEARGGRRVDTEGYFLRRAFRIVPLYFTAVLVATLVTAKSGADVLRALPHLLFLGNVPGAARDMYPFSGPWWTVGTEVQFYLLLPLLAVCRRSARAKAVGATLLATYAGVYGALATGWLRLDDVQQFSLAHTVVGRGPAFLAGILAAVLYERHADTVRAFGARHGWRARLAGDAALVAAILGLAFLLRWVVTSGSYVEFEVGWPVWRIAESALWAAVLLVLVGAPLHLRPLFANRAWALLGVTSYSIYLVHTPLLLYGRDVANVWFPTALRGWGPASAAVVLAIATIALALAALTYRLIEQPWMRRKVRVPVFRPQGVPGTAGPLHARSGFAGARLHHAPPPGEDL